jgi:hypothetical protein
VAFEKEDGQTSMEDEKVDAVNMKSRTSILDGVSSPHNRASTPSYVFMGEKYVIPRWQNALDAARILPSELSVIMAGMPSHLLHTDITAMPSHLLHTDITAMQTQLS